MVCKKQPHFTTHLYYKNSYTYSHPNLTSFSTHTPNIMVCLRCDELKMMYSTAEEGLCVLAEIFIFVSFSSLYVLATLTRGPDDALVSLR